MFREESHMKSEYFRVFRSFADESRVRVLELLCEGEKCACILLDDLKISQPTLSHHMKILCESGIVRSRRVGRWSYYSINTEGCEYASKLLNAVVNRHMGSAVIAMSAVYHCLRPFKVLFGMKTLAGPHDTCCSCAQTIK